MTYKDIQEKVKEALKIGKSLPLMGENENDEIVIVDILNDVGDAMCFDVSTMQDNDCVRHNIFHEDGTIEEYYER